MFRRIRDTLFGKNLELSERMFRAITIIGGITTLLGTIESFFVGKLNSVLFPAFLLLLAAMAVSIAVVFRYKKYDIASVILFFLIICFVFPCLFFFGGGVYGAASIWYSLGLIYVFIMFKGRRLTFMLTFCLLVYGSTYLITYYKPEIVTRMASSEALYWDIFFGALAVGLTGGLVIKSQLHIFEEEHKTNLKQKDELKKSRDSRNVFFANMSHEIRTPINTIMGLNEMILREDSIEKIKEYALDCRAASNLLLEQVNDVIDLSQMETDKMRLQLAPYQTVDTLTDLIELVRARMENVGIQLCLEIDPKIPSALIGDEKRLRQVLVNLLDNAIKYTDEGRITFSVHVEELYEKEVVLKIQVSDTGIGIRKEDMETLFDSFKRFDENRNKKVMGSGLGLSITKQLVELMDGEITVDSIYRKGTTFSIVLNQKIEQIKPIGQIDLLSYSNKEKINYRPCFKAPEARVLVVDDNAMNAKVIAGLLAETEVQVDVAQSGMECLEKTMQKFYHVILLDYMMPGMDGLETLKNIRKQENGLCRDSCVLVQTANVMSMGKESYEQLGFDGFLEKPIKGRVLELELLSLLPEDIVEHQEDDIPEVDNISFIQKRSTGNRKRVCITSDSSCDLSNELMEKYDINLIYSYIRTPVGRFMDVKEISADSLNRFVTENTSNAYTEEVTVEEYEDFFSDMLERAETVIHISEGSGISNNYNIAKTAAESFDHVIVIDSMQFSGGEGLLVLHALQMALEGKRAPEIVKEIEALKTRVHTAFVLPGAKVFYQNGYMRTPMYMISQMFAFHPYATFSKKGAHARLLLSGSKADAWKQGIRWHLRNRRKINSKVVYITHVGCNVNQLEMIIKEVQKCISFDRVIIQRASCSNACKVGEGSIGISYCI